MLYDWLGGFHANGLLADLCWIPSAVAQSNKKVFDGTDRNGLLCSSPLLLSSPKVIMDKQDRIVVIACGFAALALAVILILERL